MKLNLTTIAQRPFPSRLGFFIIILLLSWLPYAATAYFFVKDANTRTIFAMVPLAIEFLLLLPWWGKYIQQQPHIFRHYGLEFTRQNGVELLKGIAIGVISVQILFIIQGILGWVVWQQPSDSLLKFILEGSLTGLGVAFAEELFFRGWIYDELERDYNPGIVLWASAVIFAALHFIKPLPEIIRTSPQFFGLLLLGLICVWAKRSCRGRLGLPIGIHGGLVWGYYIINVGNLIQYSGNVPNWVTGIDGNPLAGIMGLLFLCGLGWWMQKRTIKT